MSDELDDTFEKTSSKREFDGAGGLGKLPDGKHTFEITGAEFKVLVKSKIFVLKLAVDVGAERIEGKKEYWIEGKDGLDEKRLNETKSDLALLGFDVDQWTRANLRPFSSELNRACLVMPGLKFKGSKKENKGKDGGKTFVNIYVDARDPDDGRPQKFNGDDLEKAKITAEEIPF
jgi:hypothetical protein